MRSLDTARDLCGYYHPGLIKALGDIPYEQREAPGSPVIDLFRGHGGAGLLVPKEYGGHGADPLDAVRVQFALGSLSPSLAAAATMHHFTAATLYALAPEPGRYTVAQREVLARVAPERLLMASGWAEGRTGQNILAPRMTATPVDGGYLLHGAKKPCSLSGSMELFTASAVAPGADGGPELVLAMLPVPTAGLSVHPFWGNDVLAAAESHEVRLEDVFVPEELVVRSTAEDPNLLGDLQSTGFVWFEMLISAGYVGAAAALVEQVLLRERGTAGERAALAVRADAALALLENTARLATTGADGAETVAQALVARYTVQDLLAQTVDQAVELLGGMDFIGSGDHARLATAVRALGFHPPGRGPAAEPLLSWFTGGPLDLA